MLSPDQLETEKKALFATSVFGTSSAATQRWLCISPSELGTDALTYEEETMPNSIIVFLY